MRYTTTPTTLNEAIEAADTQVERAKRQKDAYIKALTEAVDPSMVIRQYSGGLNWAAEFSVWSTVAAELRWLVEEQPESTMQDYAVHAMSKLRPRTDVCSRSSNVMTNLAGDAEREVWLTVVHWASGTL